MDQRRHRRRAFHGVGQPRVQAQLRRLAHRADEQQQADHGDGVEIEAEHVQHGVRLIRHGGKNGIEMHGIEQQKRGKNTKAEAEVTDPVDDERFDCSCVRAWLFVPKPDQQVTGKADPFPTEEHLHQVVGGDQHQHHEGEQAEIRHKARHRRIVMHVADGIHVHHRGYHADHDHHYGRQRVDLQCP